MLEPIDMMAAYIKFHPKDFCRAVYTEVLTTH